MTEEPDADAIAGRIKHAQDTAVQVQCVTARYPGFGIDQAYDIAHRIHQARVAEGAVPAGRKIGFTNSAIWPKYGVHAPIWGYVYDTTVMHIGRSGGVVALERLVQPKIEPEIVLHFSGTPPEEADPAAILSCVDWVASAFEIVQCHYPDWRFQAPDSIADSGLHGALLVGSPTPVSALGPAVDDTLASLSMTLYRGDHPLETGRGANALGSPLAAAAHLVSLLAGQGFAAPLRAGDIVTTGTLTAAYDIHAGEHWSSTIGGADIPGLRIEVR